MLRVLREKPKWMLFIRGVILVSIKLVFTDFNIDGEYAIVLSYRMVRGDHMIAQMWEPHQTSAFLNAFFIAIYLWVTGTTTGIALYLNIVGLIAKLGVAYVFYRTFCKFCNRNILFLMTAFFLTVNAKWEMQCLFQPSNKKVHKMNQITIIIPNYNGANFLKECLEALYSQENAPGCRVLIVDNGSTDGSLELLKEHFPQVPVIALPENTGFCHAVNAGIEASDTPYIILLNNDTKAHPGFVRALYDAIEANPSLFSVSARMLMWDKPELLDGAGDRYCVLGWAYSRGKGKPASAYGKAAEIFSACGGAAIYRKSVFEEIGLFDEAHFAYLEDLDIGYRARIHGYRNYYEPSAKVIHYGSASTGSRYNEWKTVQAAANSVYVIAKNMPLLQLIWNYPFFLAGFFVKFLFFCKKGMGRLYLKGLAEGVKKSLSRTGRARKTAFLWENLGNYLAIQGQLYLNLLRILKKS